MQLICQTGYSRDRIGVSLLTVESSLHSWKMDTPVYPAFLCHSAVPVTMIRSHQIDRSGWDLHLHFILSTKPKPTPPPSNPTLPAVSLYYLSMPGLDPDLLKSVPVSWARMRKERDWVVPVRGCQSSVSWISLFLLRSLGIKQGRFSTLRPCLHTHTQHTPSSSARQLQVNTTPTRDYSHTHTPTQLIRWPWK